MEMFEEYARRAGEELVAWNRAETPEDREVRRARALEYLELRDKRAQTLRDQSRN